MSLLYFGLLAIHLAAGAALAGFLIRLARRHGRSGRKYSVPIVIGSYLLVFWDVIPTAIVHEYLCRTQAGVTVYKDANAWIAEHPEAAKNVGPFIGDVEFRINEDRRGYWLNNRFYVDKASHKVDFLPVFVNLESIHDGQTGDMLIERRWISSGYLKTPAGGLTLGYIKGWVGSGYCFTEMDTYNKQYRVYDHIGGEQR